VSASVGVEQPASERPARREHIPLGIAYMIGATLVFAGSSALSKWLIETYPIGEVLFTRALTSLIACALIILPRRGLIVFRTSKLRDHALRGVSQATSQAFLLIAFSLMPFAGAVAINFSSPLFATLLSMLLLKEPVGATRWAVLLIGFLGVLIVAHPGADSVQLGSLFALMNAVLFGSVTTAVRRMTATESTETLTLYQMVFLTAAFALVLPFGFITPTWGIAAVMVLNGLANAVGQFWWTRALHLAPTSAVAPFNYFALVWAMILGFLIWNELPTLSLLIGSAIVVGSGFFLLWRESRPKQAAGT
jgi:drug/metabolite transporter (DMT)-like permease